MSSILGSQGMALATAMAAVSGTVIVLSFCLQKSLLSTPLPLNIKSHSSSTILRSSISSNKKKKKKNKKVKFAEDVVDQSVICKNFSSSSSTRNFQPLKTEFEKSSGDGKRGMPENRVALYNGILRDRLVSRLAYFVD